LFTGRILVLLCVRAGTITETYLIVYCLDPRLWLDYA